MTECHADPAPWQTMWDAKARLEDAGRAVETAADDFDRALAAAEFESARAEYDRAQEHMGAVGGLLILMALDHAGLPLQKKLADVFGGLGAAAYQRAGAAGRRALWALAELDALRQRVKELEALVADLTPGAGEPVLLAADGGAECLG